MAKLKVPSLQHLARNWKSDSQSVKKSLIRLVQNPPTFSYEPLFGVVRDILVLLQPYAQIEEVIMRGIKRENVRNNFLEVLPLIRDHFAGIASTFVQTVDRRFYPVGRNLLVPFDPPLIYGSKGQIHFPWFSFWRVNPLADERLALFVSVVEDVLLQDPDLERANFEILDFSVTSPGGKRELNVIQAASVPRISPDKRAEMLATFTEGYFLAEAELAGMKDKPSEEQREQDDDRDQPGLFDGDS